jgi:hypothetical protein
MQSTLDAHHEDDAYYLTAANVPAKIGEDGCLHEYREFGSSPWLVASPRGAAKVTRFEFLAHLAARDESSLYTVGEVAIAVRGFAGGQGWAFERDPGRDPKRGKVRLATRAELDAEDSDAAREIDRAHFVDVAMYGQPASDWITGGEAAP